MDASRYVGRVGGLAVALGIGTAIFMGHGVASASTGTDSNDGSTSSAANAGPASASAGKPAAKTRGKHRADDATDGSSSVTSITSRVSATHVKKTHVNKTDAVVDTAVAQKTSTRVSAWKTNVANDALSPLSGNGPVTPAHPLGDLLLLAATRREASAAAPVTPPSSITITDKVITGCVVVGCVSSSDGLPLAYTIIGSPTNGGKVAVSTTDGSFSYLPFESEDGVLPPDQSFKVMVAQTTKLDTFLTKLPLVGANLIAPTIMTLQRTPVLSVVLAPLIGSAFVQTVDANFVDNPDLAGKTFAYTTFVTSSTDGTQISTNFFPGLGTPDLTGDYPTILYGPGLASPGATDPSDPFVSTFRNQGYNVVTWDPRGEFASGGVLQLDSPQFEGQDVSSIITWVAQHAPGAELDSSSPIPNDPRVGMVGVSYGGGIQLVTAATDKRIDAISPGWAWNTLPDSLYPTKDFKTAYSSLLLLGLVTTGARINSQIYSGIITGALLGRLTPSQVALLQNSGPGFTVGQITAPTLLVSGTVDVLFPLEQSIINAGYLTDPGLDGQTALTKLIWFCGGHGSCLPGQGDPAADQAFVLGETVNWMNYYVQDGNTTGLPSDEGAFEWSDQNGTHWSSEVLPSDPGFDNGPTLHSEGVGPGKLLPILPVVGGSGPQNEVPLPYSLGDASVAKNAINVQIVNPEGTTNVVGAPTVSFSYSGVGTSRFVYGQIVDKTTGLVVGNIVTPIPVTLDGKQHTVNAYALNDIAYTMDQNSNLELQLTTSATAYLNFTQYGFVKIDDVSVDLPTTTNGTPLAQSSADAVAV